jgi:hypothetical protein
LERDLFIIINAHHDDWIKQNYANAGYRARFDSIWSQIAKRFSSKPEKLVFEILNEPYGLTKEQNDELHGRVLSIIRKTNPTRIVIFQGHNWGGSDELITSAIPNDHYVIGSFHSYDPYEFGLLGQGTWGTAADVNALNNKFNQVKKWSDDHHTPVILGEFGSLATCDYNSRMKHYSAYVELARKYGFIYCAWDDGGDFRILRRTEKKWDEIKDILLHTTAGSPRNPSLKIIQDTIIQLSWTNMSSEQDSLYIERRTMNSDYFQIGSIKGDSAVFSDRNPVQGQFNYYRIRTYNNDGEVLYSYPVRLFMPVYVPKTRIPYLGEPTQIPGTVEAENYDLGGEGLSYHDCDAMNIAGDYRPAEGVDIYSRNGDGFHIGNALPGEWYEYTVLVEKVATYKVDFYLASIQGGGKFRIKIGGEESDTLTAPGSYSWLTTTKTSTIMDLDAGEQIMRFSVIESPMFNFDKVVFEIAVTPTINRDRQYNTFYAFQNQNHELVFDLNPENTIKWIRVCDITGRLICTVRNPEKNQIISTLGMPEGIYIFEALTDDGLSSVKIRIN